MLLVSVVDVAALDPAVESCLAHPIGHARVCSNDSFIYMTYDAVLMLSMT